MRKTLTSSAAALAGLLLAAGPAGAAPAVASSSLSLTYKTGQCASGQREIFVASVHGRRVIYCAKSPRSAHVIPRSSLSKPLYERIKAVLHRTGFVRSSMTRAKSPTKYIRSLVVQTYMNAGGCWDLALLRTYISQWVVAGGERHARGSLTWSLPGAARDVLLALDARPCYHRHPLALVARLTVARFVPPASR